MIYLSALLGVMLLLVLGLARYDSTGPRRFREGRVVGIVGRKGHGKTTFGVHEMARHYKRRVWCPECSEWHMPTVATNGNLNLPAKLQPHLIHVATWEELLTLPHGTLVVIDEAHLWAPALQAGQLPKHVRWYLSQCRKLHHEIIWISQHEDRVSLGLRRQTDEVGVCRKGFLGGMKVQFFDIDVVRKKDVRPLWVYRYRINRRLSALFNTYQLLVPAEDAGAGEGVTFATDGRPVVAPATSAGRLRPVASEAS